MNIYTHIYIYKYIYDYLKEIIDIYCMPIIYIAIYEAINSEM